MNKFFCLLLAMVVYATSSGQKKLGLVEYVTNTTVGIQAIGAGVLNGTGVLFAFETGKGLVPSVITNKHLLTNASTVTFFFLEADASNMPLYGKPQQITINKSDLVIIDHPDKDIDLALIPVASILNYFNKNKINISYHPLNEHFIVKDSVVSAFSPVEDVLLVGYPAGLQKELNGIPLIKHGKTATPVFLDHNRKKEFLVDVSAYDGACGAPVFLYQNDNTDRFNEKMMGMRVLLAGITTAVYSRDFKEMICPSGQKNIPQENTSIVIKSQRILEFKKVLNDLNLRLH